MGAVVSSDELLSMLAVVEADEVVGAVLSAEECDDVAAEEQPVRHIAAIRAAAISFTFMVNFLSGYFLFFFICRILTMFIVSPTTTATESTAIHIRLLLIGSSCA